MKRETLTLLITLITPVVMAIVSALYLSDRSGMETRVNAHTDAAVATLRQGITENLQNYVTKSDYQRDQDNEMQWRIQSRSASATAQQHKAGQE